MLNELDIKYSAHNSKEGPGLTDIYRVTDLKSASNEDLTFCSSDDVEKASRDMSKSIAKVILCHLSLKRMVYPNSVIAQSLIFVENPRLAIMKIINYIYYSPCKQNKSQLNDVRRSGRDLTGEFTKLASSAIILEGARIGNGCSIGNFTKIGDRCIIGDHTVVGDHVIIEQNTRIGKNCIIQPGTVIGS